LIRLTALVDQPFEDAFAIRRSLDDQNEQGVYMRVSYFLIFAIPFLAGCMEQEHTGMSIKEIFPDPTVRALASAAAKGNIREVDSILSRGVNINFQGKSGLTPLWWALAETNYVGFEHLLEKKADPNIQVRDGYENVMYTAAELKQTKFLEATIKAGGNVNLVSAQWSNQVEHALSEGKTPLFAAITMHNHENVAILLNAGANINFQDPKGNTPLITAGFSADFKIMHFLLVKGADPNLENKVGHTLIWPINHAGVSEHSAEYQWRQKVIDLLKDRGISMDEY
jgi:ankyrin repeat protein